MPFMYILRCSDESTYIGSTMDLENRVWQHNEGKGAKYTAHRLPVVLAYFEEFDDIQSAFKREKQIQNWSRAKREALIAGEAGKLKAAAKKNFRQKN